MVLFGTLGNKTTPLYGGGQVPNPSNVLVLTAAPSANAVGNPVGTIAVDRVAGISYMAVKNTGLSGTVTWAILGGATAAIATINSNAPIAGNYVLAGTANQITITQTAGTSTFTIPAAFIAPGSIAATSTVTGGTGVIATTGNVVSSAGAVAAATTVTGGTGVIATTGNVSATAGAVNAGTTITASSGDITATNGDFVASTAAKGPKVVGTTVTGATPVVNSVRAGQVGFSDVINAAAVGALVMTNTLVSATSKIIAIATCATVGSAVQIRDMVPGSGTVTFNVTNLGGSNTATTIFINFWILN